MLFPGFILSLFCKSWCEWRSPVARRPRDVLVHLALIPPAGAGLRLLGIRIPTLYFFADALFLISFLWPALVFGFWASASFPTAPLRMPSPIL